MLNDLPTVTSLGSGKPGFFEFTQSNSRLPWTLWTIKILQNKLFKFPCFIWKIQHVCCLTCTFDIRQPFSMWSLSWIIKKKKKDRFLIRKGPVWKNSWLFSIYFLKSYYALLNIMIKNYIWVKRIRFSEYIIQYLCIETQTQLNYESKTQSKHINLH